MGIGEKEFSVEIFQKFYDICNVFSLQTTVFNENTET